MAGSDVPPSFQIFFGLASQAAIIYKQITNFSDLSLVKNMDAIRVTKVFAIPAY
jgi:hypothetical protein